MFVRKNYYLYAENAEKQNEKKKLLGSVRLTRIEEQWTMEIQWKDENDAAALVSKAEEEELQLQIKEKEINRKGRNSKGNYRSGQAEKTGAIRSIRNGSRYAVPVTRWRIAGSLEKSIVLIREILQYSRNQ